MKEQTNTYYESLNNPHGGIYLVSSLADKEAISNALNAAEIAEIDSKSSLEDKSNTIIKQFTRTDKLTSYNLDIDNRIFGDKSSPISRLLKHINMIKTKYYKQEKYDPIFLIALNKNDVTKYTDIIRDTLRAKGYTAYVVSITLGKSSVKEAEKYNREAFTQALRRTYTNPDNKFQNFINWITQHHDSSISTGLSNVDELLGGGISNQLYVLGAPSSIGKTTFAWQVANHIASQMHHVFYYALEMSSNQLISKAINRLSYIDAEFGQDYTDPQPTVNDIYLGQWKERWNKAPENYKHVNIGLHQYGDLSAYLHIRDDMLVRPTASKIRKDITDCIAHNPAIKPVVIIDYLQLLQSEEGHEYQTDKQRISDAIWTLKMISRDFNIPVIVISSFNRSAYNDNNADMSAFKESGDIDYSAEVMLTLTYDFDTTLIQNTDGLKNKTFKNQTIQNWLNETKADIREAFTLAKQQPRRGIKLKILKNRFGAIAAPAKLITIPRFDIFFDLSNNGKISLTPDNFTNLSQIKDNQIIYND